MATCPNKNTVEWKELQKVLGSEELAYRAYMLNNFDIPSVDSQLVKDIKEKTILKTGDEEVVLQNPNDDFYLGKETGTKFQRGTEFIDGNFRSSKKDKTLTDGERIANKRWGDLDPSVKLYDPISGDLETYNEAVARINLRMKENKLAGNIAHLILEAAINPLKAKDLDEAINNQLNQIGESRQSKFYSRLLFFKNKEVQERLFKFVGINTMFKLHKDEEIFKDVVYAEQTISSNLLKIATTIDTLVWHSDNTWSIIDWKTGSSLESWLDTNILMKYGNTSTIEVEDTLRNKAKLEVMLRAFILKLNNPDIKFNNLLVTWIPDEFHSHTKDRDQQLNPTAFLDIIKAFLLDKEALKANGLSETLYYDVLKKSPNIFNASDYSSNSNNDVIIDIVKNNKTPKSVLQDAITELQYLVARTESLDKLSQKQKDRMAELQRTIFEFTADPGFKLDDSGQIMDDISMLSKAFMSYGDVTHPLVATWIKFRNQREFEFQEKYRLLENQFKSALHDLEKEMNAEKNFVWTPFGKIIDYDKMYGWAYIDEEVEGFAHKRERLLHDHETNIDFKIKYEALSPVKKRFLNIYNTVAKSYFEGEGAFLNEKATFNAYNKPVSHLDVYNMTQRQGLKFKYYDGFFFKIPPTNQEIYKRNGGRLSMKTIKMKSLYLLTDFVQDNYEIPQRSYYRYIPLQYLGSLRIDSQRMYTKNLEFSFIAGVQALEKKRSMDAVLQLGNALQYYLSQQTQPDDPAEPMYPQLADYLKVKLVHDIIGTQIKSKYTSKKFRAPILTPDGWEDQPLHVEKILKAMMSWVTMSVMWVKPIQGMGNGIHGTLLTHRDALKGSISKVGIHGVKDDDIDFQLNDIYAAEAIYFKEYLVHAMEGKLMEDKMFLMARHLNYFGNNYDYAMMDKALMTKSTRHLSPSTYYMFHSMPEEFISLTTMVAQLRHMKVEGTNKSLWDLYKVKKVDEAGNVYDIVYEGPRRGSVKTGTQSINGVETAVYTPLYGLSAQEIGKLKRVHERLQGGYRREEAMYIEAYVLGKTFVQLKKYFPRLLINAFHSKKLDNGLGFYKQMFVDGKPALRKYKDENGKEVEEPIYEWQKRLTEGRWTTIIGAMGYYLSLGNGKDAYNIKKMQPEQVQNLIEAAITILFWAQFYGLYLLLFNSVDDDDTAKKWWKMYLVDNLSQQYNVFDLAKSLKTIFTPVIAAKVFQTVDGINTLMFSSIEYAITKEESALWTKNGDMRGLNNILKQIPGAAQILDLKNKFENNESMGDMFDELRLR